MRSHERWLKVYQNELEMFTGYAKDPNNRQSGIAFVAFNSKEKVDRILSKTKKFTRIGGIQVLFLDRSASRGFAPKMKQPSEGEFLLKSSTGIF